MAAAEFMQKFETKFCKAQYDEITHWFAIEALKTNLHPGLMAKVYACTVLLDNYADFKALIV